MEKRGYVYLIGKSDTDGIFKIGVTTGKLENRIKKLQTGSDSELFLVDSYQTEFPFFLEKSLHFKFSDKRLSGEWFSLTNEEALKFKSFCKEIEDRIDSLKDNVFFQKTLFKNKKKDGKTANKKTNNTK